MYELLGVTGKMPPLIVLQEDSADSNGKLTSQEFAAFVHPKSPEFAKRYAEFKAAQKSDGADKPFYSPIADRINRILDFVLQSDKDSDGFLSKEEATADSHLIAPNVHYAEPKIEL